MLSVPRNARPKRSALPKLATLLPFLKYVSERCDLFLRQPKLLVPGDVFRSESRVCVAFDACVEGRKGTGEKTTREWRGLCSSRGARTEGKEKGPTARQKDTSREIRFWTKWQLDRADRGQVLTIARCNVSSLPGHSVGKTRSLFINFNEITRIAAHRSHDDASRDLMI